jgi:hypothetical protein
MSTYFQTESQKHASTVARVNRLRSLPTLEETLTMLKERKEAQAIVIDAYERDRAMNERRLIERHTRPQARRTILQKLRLKR